MRVKVLKNFNYAKDGLTQTELAAGDEHDIADAHVQGLADAGLIDSKPAADQQKGAAADVKAAEKARVNAEKAADKAEQDAAEATATSAATLTAKAKDARDTANRMADRHEAALTTAARLQGPQDHTFDQRAVQARQQADAQLEDAKKSSAKK